MEYDEVGIAYDTTDIENPIPLNGWHVNTLSPIENAEEFLITPMTPFRVYFGNPKQYCYVFEDKQQFMSYISDEDV